MLTAKFNNDQFKSSWWKVLCSPGLNSLQAERNNYASFCRHLILLMTDKVEVVPAHAYETIDVESDDTTGWDKTLVLIATIYLVCKEGRAHPELWKDHGHPISVNVEYYRQGAKYRGYTNPVRVKSDPASWKRDTAALLRRFDGKTVSAFVLPTKEALWRMMIGKHILSSFFKERSQQDKLVHMCRVLATQSDPTTVPSIPQGQESDAPEIYREHYMLGVSITKKAYTTACIQTYMQLCQRIINEESRLDKIRCRDDDGSEGEGGTYVLAIVAPPSNDENNGSSVSNSNSSSRNTRPRHRASLTSSSAAMPLFILADNDGEADASTQREEV